MKPLILVLIFSVFEYLSATIDNGYGYVNGYAMAVGGVSSVLSCGLFVASLQPSRLMKMVLCARHRKVEDHRGITRTVKTRWPAGDVTMERLLAFVLFMWWMVAAAFLKFDGPMAVKFNNKPKVGIFLKESGHSGYILASIEGKEWIIDEKQINKMEVEKRLC